MFEDSERKEITDLGEFGLIKLLTEDIKLQHADSVLGIGDDAAVIGTGEIKTVISTDMLLENVHFDLSFHPLRHLGFKAIAVNVSDLYAMNATPRQVLVSIAASNRFSVQALEELYEGIKKACEVYGVDLVGGDTSTSRQGLVISVTAIGTAAEKDIVQRKGAKEGDLLCVSGDLGAAFMGLQLLEREKRIFLENPQMQPDLEGNDYILQRQLKPEARKDIIEKLGKAGILPTSMIDVSDGLASEIFHLCTHSNVGMKVYEIKLPIDPTTFSKAEEFGLDPTTIALNGGEDYELLFTVSQGDFEKIRGIEEISIIGHCTAATEGVQLVTKNDNQFALKAQGWKHF